jgi:phosphoribosylformimino-5-aminoimidazole carboxamide ribotide isomerase
MEIIPSIDLRAGRVVRLEQGDYARETVFEVDPAEVTRRFVRAGATRIHVVDLDGARDGGEPNRAASEAILNAAGSVPVQLGGGMRNLEQIDAALGRGFERVVLGTLALREPELFRRAALRHPGRLILGLDAKGNRVAVAGWRELGEASPAAVLERFADLPLAAILHTVIERDGLLGGPDVESTVRLARSTKVPVLASGGVRSEDDLVVLARTRVIAGAVVGRALHAGSMDLASALQKVAAC